MLCWCECRECRQLVQLNALLFLDSDWHEGAYSFTHARARTHICGPKFNPLKFLFSFPFSCDSADVIFSLFLHFENEKVFKLLFLISLMDLFTLSLSTMNAVPLSHKFFLSRASLHCPHLSFLRFVCRVCVRVCVSVWAVLCVLVCLVAWNQKRHLHNTLQHCCMS